MSTSRVSGAAFGGAAWLALGLLGGGLAGCGGGSSSAVDAGTPSPSTLGEALDDLIDEYGLASISVGVVQDGEPTALVARGWADVDAERAATPDTIYALASCSKPIVGLAAALLVEEMPDVDLDDDVQDWLEWDPPLAHPDYPDRDRKSVV